MAKRSNRITIGMRVPRPELEQIDKLASQRGLTRTDYMIQAALGTLDTADLEANERFERVETRLDRLEQLASNSYT